MRGGDAVLKDGRPGDVVVSAWRCGRAAVGVAERGAAMATSSAVCPSTPVNPATARTPLNSAEATRERCAGGGCDTGAGGHDERAGGAEGRSRTRNAESVGDCGLGPACASGA